MKDQTKRRIYTTMLTQPTLPPQSHKFHIPTKTTKCNILKETTRPSSHTFLLLTIIWID